MAVFFLDLYFIEEMNSNVKTVFWMSSYSGFFKKELLFPLKLSSMKTKSIDCIL